MRRQLPLPTLIRIVSVCALVLLLGSGAASFGVHAAPSQQVTTFAFTDAAQTYTVPAGVTQITVLLSGAQGGSGSKGNAGGLGGQATATIAVTPGETLQVNVGVRGETVMEVVEVLDSMAAVWVRQLISLVAVAAVHPIFGAAHLPWTTGLSLPEVAVAAARPAMVA